jgi:hypothetical protein
MIIYYKNVIFKSKKHSYIKVSRMKKEKIVIVGSGPTGLTLAHYLSREPNLSITVIEREETIGGCHRVRRVSDLFTEHGPRIYTGAYTNFKRLLKEDLKTDFKDLFIPYKFPITQIGGQTFTHLGVNELFSFGIEFVKLIFTNSSKNVSVLEFAEKNNFSKESINYIDRVCRLTDGAGIERYTLFEFLQLANQHAFYGVYQPREPTDDLLFPIWQRYLESRGVKFMLSKSVVKISSDATEVYYKEQNNLNSLRCDKLFLAIPPQPTYKLLYTSNLLQSFGSGVDLKKWSEQSRYITYIPITYHYEKDISNTNESLSNSWGFSETDWGIVWIILSDYFQSVNNTLISIAITRPNDKSSFTNKSANESSFYEIKTEVFRQMRQSFPDLPYPDKELISPGVYRDEFTYKTLDQAYVSTPNETIVGPVSCQFPNRLFSVGTHNGNSEYHFTSFESAVTSAIVLVNKMYPEQRIKVLSPVSITSLFTIFIIVFILYLFLTYSY